MVIEFCKLLNFYEFSIGLFILFLRRKFYLVNNFKFFWFNVVGICNIFFFLVNVKFLSFFFNLGCVFFLFGFCWLVVNDDRFFGKLLLNV